MRTRRGIAVLLAGSAVLAGLRLLLASRVEALTSLPDEIGFLGNAWALGHGGIDPPMAFSPSYPGGYPLLLAPLAALTDDPGTLAAWARVVQVVLLAGVAPALWAVLGRLGRLAPVPRALAALAGSALPGLWVAGLLAWPDALAALVWPSALVALAALARPGRLVARIWFGPLVALLWCAHARFLPVLVLAAALLVLRLVAPAADGPGRAADAATLVLGGAVVAVGAAVDAALSARWDQVADGPLTGLADEPARAAGGIARAFVGESWYLSAGTLGLAAVGLVTLLGTARRASGRGRWTDPVPLVAGAAAVGAVAVQVAAAVQLRRAEGLAPGVAFDLVANGRYQEVVLAPLVAVGLARLVRRATASLGLEAAVVAGTTAVAVVVGLATTSPPTRVDPATMAGTSWGFDLWPDAPTVLPTLGAGVALALAAVLRVADRRGRAVAVPLAALLVLSALGWDAGTEVVDRSAAAARVRPDLDRVRDRLDGRSSALAVDPGSLPWSFGVGWELADEGVVTFTPGEEPPRALVLAPVGPDGGSPVEGLEGAVLTTMTPLRSGPSPVGLWVRPGATRDALAEDGLVYPEAGELLPLTALRARIEAAAEVAADGTGPVPVEVAVTHAGWGHVWPDAPGHVGLALVAVDPDADQPAPPEETPSVDVGEVDPGGTVRLRLDLRPLADALGPGRHTVELRVRLPLGPLSTVGGPARLELVVA